MTGQFFVRTDSEATDTLSDELQRAWKSFVTRGLHTLKIRSEKEEIPEVEKVSLRVKDGETVEEVVRVPVYDAFLERSKNQLSGLTEYLALVALMRADVSISKHIGQIVRTAYGGGTASLWDYAKFPLARQLEKAEPFVLDDKLLETTLSELLTFFSKETVVFLHVVPLQNFDSEIEEIRLGPRLRVRRIDKDELLWLLNLIVMAGIMPFFKAYQFKFVIEVTAESPKYLGDQGPPIPVSDPFDLIGRIVTSFRLLKPGKISCSMMRTIPAIQVPSLPSSGSSREPVPSWGSKYLLRRGEESTLAEVWQQLENRDFNKPDPVNVALRRFNFSVERSQVEDKMIDLMIAFEALLLNEEGSPTHKLALRFAKLLGNTFEERMTLYKEMKGFYKIRSKIVHGESTRTDEQVVLGVEERLRSSVRSVLGRVKNQTHSMLLKRLDLDP